MHRREVLKTSAAALGTLLGAEAIEAYPMGVNTNSRPSKLKIYRHADPTPIGNVMLTGINIPIRIGNTTIMPGDLVVGDREGVYFIPPQFVKSVLDQADEIHIHDEWTKKKFAE